MSRSKWKIPFKSNKNNSKIFFFMFLNKKKKNVTKKIYNGLKFYNIKLSYININDHLGNYNFSKKEVSHEHKKKRNKKKHSKKKNK